MIRGIYNALAALSSSTGSALIGFIQAGAGAVLRTVQSKLREFASPSDYDTVEDMLASGKPFVAGSDATYAYGTLKGFGSVNATDYATLGAELLTNGGFTGSATGWTLSNFTYGSDKVTHVAGTVGYVEQNVSVSPYTLYLVQITPITTTVGAIGVSVAGSDIVDPVPSGFPIGSGTTYQYVWFSSTETGSVAFRVYTDTSWAGDLNTVSLKPIVEQTLANVTIASDDTTARIPYGERIGRFNAGNMAKGDRQTLAYYTVNAAWNIGNGPRVLSSVGDGIENAGNGAFALQYYNGSFATATGYSSLKYAITGTGLAFHGYKSGYHYTAGSRGTGNGFQVLFNNAIGDDNTGDGYQALYNVLDTSGNTGTGSQAGLNCRGTGNSFHGSNAGQLNNNANTTYTYDYTSSYGASTRVYGDNGTALGYGARVGADGSPVNNAIAIGSGVVNTLANSAVIGTALDASKTSGRHFSKFNVAGISDAAGVTYTANQFCYCNLIVRSGPGAGFSDTTPTAAAIVASIPGCEVGSGFNVTISNLTAFTLTILAGSGVTLEPSTPTTVGAGKSRMYQVQVTGVGSGAETVYLLGVMSGDN